MRHLSLILIILILGVFVNDFQINGQQITLRHGVKWGIDTAQRELQGEGPGGEGGDMNNGPDGDNKDNGPEDGNNKDNGPEEGNNEGDNKDNGPEDGNNEGDNKDNGPEDGNNEGDNKDNGPEDGNNEGDNKDNGPEDGDNKDEPEEPENPDDCGPDHHHCAPTPLPSPYQAHPNFNVPTPRPTPAPGSSGSGSSDSAGLFKSQDYAQDAEIGMALGTGLAVCALLFGAAYVAYKAKTHVTVARRIREHMYGNGHSSDDPSVIEIALAMLEGGDFRGQQRRGHAFDASMHSTDGLTDSYDNKVAFGTAMDVSLRDSQRGPAYGQSNEPSRYMPSTSKFPVPSPPPGARMGSSSHGMNVSGHGGVGMGASRHGYDSAENPVPAGFGTVRKTKVPPISPSTTSGFERPPADI
eukprot:CAMPEP_0185042094 /NCGR_PEP_ID=MMETSP1103-20130426/42145_1 /TAXON_ID=36769 /ORGANISM="Paraphysomonas bandaiensis, Strain Caron Lab Isolate" /LENGTH=409 /DNA_ID=CAMNT_0027582097 /DNA_START=121 /DNA_END=1350 /DNA_ORIENTATION=+